MKIVMHKSLRKLLLSFKYWRLDRSLPPFDDSADPVLAIPELSGTVPESRGDQLVIYAACDNGYYNKFGKSFIGSIISNGGACPIHLHVVNPGDETLGELGRIQSVLGEQMFSFTYEQLNLDHLSGEEPGIYYYSIRFWRMSQFVARAQCRCLCLDIDALLNGDASGLLGSLRDTDIAFFSRFEKFGGNTKLLAGTVYVGNSEAGQAYIRQVGEQIYRYIRAGILLEKFDQQVLYAIYTKVLKQFDNLVFRSLRSPEIDLEFRDEGIVWYPKGSSKRQDLYLEKEQACRAHVDKLLAASPE